MTGPLSARTATLEGDLPLDSGTIRPRSDIRWNLARFSGHRAARYDALRHDDGPAVNLSPDW
jgi:hypothetical protein